MLKSPMKNTEIKFCVTIKEKKRAGLDSSPGTKSGKTINHIFDIVTLWENYFEVFMYKAPSEKLRKENT